WPVLLNTAVFNPDSPGTEILHRRQIVRDKQYRSPVASKFLHCAEAFFLEAGIPNRKHLVYDQDFRIQVGGDRKSQSQTHTRRIAFNGSVDMPCYAGKLNNGVELRIDFFFGHSQ